MEWDEDGDRACPLREMIQEKVVKAEALRWAESWAIFCYQIYFPRPLLFFVGPFLCEIKDLSYLYLQCLFVSIDEF